jgi:thiol-disulfide isomerase/thioredoxin
MRKRIGTPAALVLLAATCAAAVSATANQAPVARLVAYRAGPELVVTYDASSSSDPDGKIVRYQWLFGDGTTGSGSPVTHMYPQVKPYPVTLLVGDDSGATALLTQVIDVSSLPSHSSSSTATAAAPSAATDVPVGNDVGQRAPGIALPDLSNDGMVNLAGYLGRVVLVEFWLSTCPGCQASTPELEEYRETYADRGLVVMLVVLDRSPSAAVSSLEQYGYTHFVLAWESDAAKPTMAAYGVSNTPTAFLVDRTGVIRYADHPSGLTDNLIKQWL